MRRHRGYHYRIDYYRRYYWRISAGVYARQAEYLYYLDIILGAVGAFVGTWVAGFFGVAHTAGIDWIRWALSVLAAMLAISVYLGVTGRK